MWYKVEGFGEGLVTLFILLLANSKHDPFSLTNDTITTKTNLSSFNPNIYQNAASSQGI